LHGIGGSSLAKRSRGFGSVLVRSCDIVALILAV
jgi:hypothetical protein